MFKKLFKKKISEPLAYFDLDSFISLSSVGFPHPEGNEIEVEVGDDYVTYTETAKDFFESIDIPFSQVEEAIIDKQENVFVLVLNTHIEPGNFRGLGKEIKVSLEGITEIDCFKDVDKIRDFINEQAGHVIQNEQATSRSRRTNCPHCNASVINVTTGICPYCRGGF